MKPIEEDGVSGLASRIIEKINELIDWAANHGKADAAWKAEAEIRLAQLEEDVSRLKSKNRGLSISKGKEAAARRRAEAKLEEARRILH